MSSIDKVNESGWRLFRFSLPIWQETFQVQSSHPAGGIYGEAESRIHRVAFRYRFRVREILELGKALARGQKERWRVMRMSRSNMELNIWNLLPDGVISIAVLDDFSEVLQEKLAFAQRNQSDWD